jgi:hypothetical protein
MEIADLPKQIYEKHDVILYLTAAVNGLFKIGTTNPLLTFDDKMILQYSHDVLKAILQAHIDERAKNPPEETRIVTATKGDLVQGTSTYFTGQKD